LISFYLLSFFLLNLYYDEFKLLLQKKYYYFVYTSIEYLTFAFLLRFFIENKTLKKYILFFSICFELFLVFYYMFSSFKRIDSVPIGIESILLFIYILFFFAQYFKSLHNDIYENFSFWFVIGILAYLGITFFFNILANSLERESFAKYFFYSYLGDIIKNILFAIGIYHYSKSRHLSNSKLKSSHIPNLDMI